MNTIKKGKQCGKQRWLCKNCGRLFVNPRKVSTEDVINAYSDGLSTTAKVAGHLGISRRTVCRRLHGLDLQAPPPTTRRGKIITMMDASYWGRSFGVVIIKDYRSRKVLWHKFIERKESVADYCEGIEAVKALGYEIEAIVADGLKGLRNRFSDIPFQLCQFHMVQYIRIKLTNNPKTLAAIELLALSRLMCETDKESFCGLFNEWEDRWKSFASEKTVMADGKKYRTHQRLWSAYSSLRRNMPWLWTWYDNIQLGIPNTNNALEGLNSAMKRMLVRHSGLSINRRKELIVALLYRHNPLNLSE